MKLNSQFWIYILFCLVSALMLLGLMFAQATLHWTAGGATLYPVGAFLKDHLWSIEASTSVAIVVWASHARQIRVQFLVWVGINTFLWLSCVTFSVLEIASHNSEIRVNGEPDGRGSLIWQTK